MARLRALGLLLFCGAAFLCAQPGSALAGGQPSGSASIADRVEELQQEIASLTEDIEDLAAPVEEFDLFDQCAFTIGVTSYGATGLTGYWFGTGGRRRRAALAMDIGRSGPPRYAFLAFPQEEPPSIECNEDAGQESTGR